jgi:hypothetical protein
MQVTKIIPIPAILVLFSPPPVSWIMTLKEDLDLPLMQAAGMVRSVMVYPDDLVVDGNLELIPSYEESQSMAGL